MFSVMDEWDKNFAIDFLLLFCYFYMYLNSLDSPNIFNYRC